MLRFLWLWLAQTVSLLGSHLSGFALGVWLFQKSGGVTLSALAAAATWLPQVLGAPIAGLLTDRFDRGRVLLAGHAGAGLCSLALLGLFLARGTVAPEVALTLLALASACRAVELPAFLSSMTMLVPAAQLGRANGLTQLGMAVPQLIAPALAGTLFTRYGLVPILTADAATFAFAVLVLTVVRVPRLAEEMPRASAQDELRAAFTFLGERPGLCLLLASFSFLNFNLGSAQVAITPLVLGFADANALGRALSTGGIGMLLGALLMVAWGGPRRRIQGVLFAALAQGLVMLCAGARASLTLVSAAAFGILFAVPIAAACSQTIWQRKVPPALQGRVFSLRVLFAGLAVPLAQLVTGPLVDRVFEPALAPHGALAPLLGPLVGTGPGRGAALLITLLGAVTSVMAVVAMFVRPLAEVEREIPDAP